MSLLDQWKRHSISKKEVLLLFVHNSNGTPEFTECGILVGED